MTKNLSISESAATLVARLRNVADPTRLTGMARYGIHTDRALGVSIPHLRAAARDAKKNSAMEERHALAASLWASELHEARILASMIDAPELVDARQMQAWAADFESWDLCDQCCTNLFRWTAPAWDQALAWSHLGREAPEFLKRAGFVLMATLAVGDKTSPDARFFPFFERIRAAVDDPRNYVKKAVNWALRQIGKRNAALNLIALNLCRELLEPARTLGPGARWVATDALRELESPEVQARLRRF